MTIHRLAPLCPLVCLGGLAAVSLMAGTASAFQAEVGGTTYEVTTFRGSYSANASRFALPSNDGQMPWWENQNLATQFAAAVADGLGLTPGIVLPLLGRAAVGPLFATATDSAVVIGEVPIAVTRNSLYYQLGLTTTGTYPIRNFPPLPIPQSGFASDSLPYAVATEVRTPSVPAPLPLVGVGAAFGFSRRLRSRIKRSRPA